MKYPGDKATFREIEHTADVGIMVEGNSLSGLFANAAYGMMHLLFGGRKALSQVRKKLHLTEPSPEELLITWLSELNYLVLVENFSLVSVLHLEITRSGKNYQLTGQIDGGKLSDPEREIKAITYHQFYLKEIRDDHYEARIIFDI